MAGHAQLLHQSHHKTPVWFVLTLTLTLTTFSNTGLCQPTASAPAYNKCFDEFHSEALCAVYSACIELMGNPLDSKAGTQGVIAAVITRSASVYAMCESVVSSMKCVHLYISIHVFVHNMYNV